MLPIVKRELQAAAQKKSLYRGRNRVALAAALLGMGLVVTAGPAKGAGTFSFLSLVATLLVLLGGIRNTSECISVERREGTLGLLFLTGLRGYDVVLGKLAANSLRSIQAVLAFLPVLSITLLLGGVTFGEFCRTAVVILTTLLASLSIGICVSTFSRDRSTLVTSVVIFSWVGITYLVGRSLQWLGREEVGILIANLCPLVGLSSASDMAYPKAPKLFWISQLMLHGISWICLLASSRLIYSLWQDQPADESKRASSPRKHLERVSGEQRKIMLEQNPVFWMAFRPGSHWFGWLFYGSLGLCFCLLLFFKEAPVPGALFALFYFLELLLICAIGFQTSSTLGEARRTGALELLFSTPLKSSEIIAGVWLALRKSFLIPVVVLLCAQVAFTLVLWRANYEMPGLLGAAKALEVLPAVLASGWMGIWMGLSQKSSNRAFAKVIGWVAIFPMVLFCVPNFLIYLVLLAVAYDHVSGDLRRVFSRYYQNSLVAV